MKLTTVRVRMFRNILDSTEVAIQPDVTCLVGKNESGKTAFLQALWRLNPARVTPTFSVPDHYPAWLEKRHCLEGQNLDEVRPVEAIFGWEAADEKAVESVFGPGSSQPTRSSASGSGITTNSSGSTAATRQRRLETCWRKIRID